MPACKVSSNGNATTRIKTVSIRAAAALSIVATAWLAACEPPPSDAELACIADYLNRTGPGVTALANRYRTNPGDGEHLYNGLAAVMRRQARLDLGACPKKLRDAHADMLAAFAPARDAVDRLVAERRQPGGAERQRILNQFKEFGDAAEVFTEDLLRYRTHPRIERQLGPWIEDLEVLVQQIRS